MNNPTFYPRPTRQRRFFPGSRIPSRPRARPEARIGVAIGQTLALLLLALACGNMGILLLARAAARAGELALRPALGANRIRIVSQLFIESLLLALFAAEVGLLSLQAVATRQDYLVAGLPFWVDFEVARPTVVLAISLAVVSAVVASPRSRLPAEAHRPRFSGPARVGPGSSSGGATHLNAGEHTRTLLV